MHTRKLKDIKYKNHWSLRIILTGFVLILLTKPTLSDKNADDSDIDWRDGYVGHGTTHEQMGQPHWADVEYTKYESNLEYARQIKNPSYGMESVFKLSHYLYDNILYDNPAIPPGYVVVKDEETLALGPKVEKNDWHALVGEYWLVFFWICFLLLLIILLPFIGVCYCCFCCCHRCNTGGCPPCVKARDFRRRMIFGFILLLLILLLVLGSVVAFLCNRLLERGIKESKELTRQGTEDICAFLKDTKEHVHHLFANNYEELLNHLTDLLSNAYKHIFVDIGDSSGSNALEQLERILDNMPAALELMKEIRSLEKQIRFLVDQLRDGLRGVKRDVNHAVAYSGHYPLAVKFLRNSLMEFVDTSVCLHIDEMPDTSVYVKGIENIIEMKAYTIPKEGILRFQRITDVITKAMEKVAPPMISDIVVGRDTMMQHSNRIQDIIDAIISDIHLHTLKSTQSFEDFYEKYGVHRTAVNISACVIIFVIISVLIIALLCGCFASRTTGATCLLLAIVLIFCAISFITLIGLFYFILGAVTYHGGCSPFKDKEASEVFRRIDAFIDLNRYVPKSDIKDPTPPLRMSNAIAACQAHQSIFNLLTESRLFDINEFGRIKIMNKDVYNEKGVQTDLSNNIILEEGEKHKLEGITKGNLSTYNSVHYLKSVCKPFTPVNLVELLSQLNELSRAMLFTPNIYWRPRRQFFTSARILYKYHTDIVGPLENAYDSLKQKLQKMDNLILVNNLEFGAGISALLTATIRGEKFVQHRGKEFIRSLITNLTLFTHGQIDDYIDMIISECNTKVGLCEPLAYIFYRSVDVVCSRLVDPINGFWLGLIPCALLFLPILFVAHRLMCLFKNPSISRQTAIVEFGRPYSVCTRLPKSTNQQKYYVNFAEKSHRAEGGVIHNEVIVLQNHPQSETFTEEEETESSLSKRKQD